MTETTMGSRIEQARVECGLTSGQLARRLGVQRKTIENWESDRSEPRSNKLLVLAGVLNVPVLWLLEGGNGRIALAPDDFNETATILQKLERATSMQQQLAALLIEATADLARLQRELDSEKTLAA